MPIELPIFKNSHCVALTLCAEVKSIEGELKKLMKTGKEAMAEYQTSLGETYFRIIFGGKKSKHLHIDVAEPDMTVKRFTPKTKASIKEMQNILEPFEGKEVEAKLRGFFKAKIKELPERGMIRTMFFETKTGAVGIQVKGAQLEIMGAPVNELSWGLLPKNEIGIILESEMLTYTISDKYLLSALDTLETAFNYFILGQSSNETR